MSANQIQIAGDHYKSLTPEPWDVIEAWKLGYLDGNALKYVSRWRSKGGLNDLKKARHYLDKLIEIEESKQMNQVQIKNQYDFMVEQYKLKDQYAKDAGIKFSNHG